MLDELIAVCNTMSNLVEGMRVPFVFILLRLSTLSPVICSDKLMK